MKTESVKIVCQNRKARHDYEIINKFEAGMALLGPEVKSLRAGKANLSDSYAESRDGEFWLYNAHISPYSHNNDTNLDPTRTRKLLLHKSEMNRLVGKIKEKGYALIPLSIYFKHGKAKVEIALAKGKKLYDKRESIKERDTEREFRREYKIR